MSQTDKCSSRVTEPLQKQDSFDLQNVKIQFEVKLKQKKTPCSAFFQH